MPDINFDTLFIVGLILASVIGQIFKKKEQETEQKKDNNSDFEPSLNDVVKEFWAKATGEFYKVKAQLLHLCGKNRL